jgi:hypothetical protein
MTKLENIALTIITTSFVTSLKVIPKTLSVYMLLLQVATITETDIHIGVLESSNLTKPEHSHTDTNEIFRSQRMEGDITVKLSQCRNDNKDDVCHIKHSLLGGSLVSDGGLDS